jgi:hypothetical protein
MVYKTMSKSVDHLRSSMNSRCPQGFEGQRAAVAAAEVSGVRYWNLELLRPF